MSSQKSRIATNSATEVSCDIESINGGVTMSSISKEQRKIDWKEYLRSENNIKELLAAVGIDEYELGIKDHTSIEIMTRYSVNDTRHGVVVKTKNMKTGHVGSIVVDSTRGEPTWKQMLELAFEVGEQCDKRIVVYDGIKDGIDEHNLSKGGVIAMVLSELFNRCGLETYLVYIRDFKKDETERKTEYDLVVDPNDFKREPPFSLPSKTRLQELEFWMMYYDTFYGSGGRLFAAPEDWIDYRSWRKGCLDYTPTWESDGLYMHAIETSEAGVDVLKELNEKKLERIRERYKDCKIKLQRRNGRPHKLSVRVWPVPFKAFMLSSPREKAIYTDQVFGWELFFFDDVSPIIEGMPTHDEQMASM